MSGRKRPGFTLVEMMVTVSIVGIISSLAAVSLISMVANGKVTGEADALASFIRNARVRAIATGCPHVVRYTGKYISVTNPGPPPTSDHGRPATLTMYRKGTCLVASNGLFTADAEMLEAPGDRLVNTYYLQPVVTVDVSTFGVISSYGYYVGFDAAGQMRAGRGTGVAAITPIAPVMRVGYEDGGGQVTPGRLIREIEVRNGTVIVN